MKVKEKEPEVIIPEIVEEDRRYLVEACIVRIMKARRRLKHNELVEEVTRQMKNKFVPQHKLIKGRVESLLEREYIERDELDSRVYKYVL